jgi:integrase
MLRQTYKLNALAVQRLNSAGRYADGGCLYLQVSPQLTKSWLFRYRLRGRSREMGLGPVSLVSLAEARAKALEGRKLLLDGVDPIENRAAKHRQLQLESAKAMTFDQCAASYINAHRAGWKNAKHAAQWESTLTTYASPVIGELAVQAVDTGLVMKVLEPIWRETPETASRLRSRIELILGWATASGYRTGDNPARWRGHLDNLLPSRNSIQAVQHHPALAINEIGAFMKRLKTVEGASARALEFLILTATRTCETLGARWNEFDLEHGTWTIPAERMKAKREHRVPLSAKAAKIIKAMRDRSQGDFVFFGIDGLRPLSNMALLQVLRRMGVQVTSHGFRSTFRDWAAEQTNFPREVAEAALAHTLKDKTEAAYRRGDLFMKRQRLMNEWAEFCDIIIPCVSLKQLTPRSPKVEAKHARSL